MNKDVNGVYGSSHRWRDTSSSHVVIRNEVYRKWGKGGNVAASQTHAQM